MTGGKVGVYSRGSFSIQRPKARGSERGRDTRARAPRAKRASSQARWHMDPNNSSRPLVRKVGFQVSGAEGAVPQELGAAAEGELLRATEQQQDASTFKHGTPEPVMTPFMADVRCPSSLCFLPFERLQRVAAAAVAAAADSLPLLVLSDVPLPLFCVCVCACNCSCCTVPIVRRSGCLGAPRAPRSQT